MTVPFKAYPTEYSQSTLLPANVFDLLPEDHDCFVFQERFQQLDTREVESTYSPRGQRAYPPRQIISILVYAYSHGVYSSRQIEKRCNEDLGFMYIAGMNCPNFRVLSDFRKDHGAFFKDGFRQTVRLAMELKLVSLGPVMDGSKFKANTSKHKAMSYLGLKEREQQLCTEIGALLEQAAWCDEKEDAQYQERTGYELPDALQHREEGGWRRPRRPGPLWKPGRKPCIRIESNLWKNKVIVEPLFGQIRNGRFRGFSVRGKEAVSGEFSLVCTAHNLKKIVKAAMTDWVRPESGNWTMMGA
ncbi:MAG: transposase [Gammaproteobacteria bacterium]|nr:transposase [Gammaproteobacteria bacterium]